MSQKSSYSDYQQEAEQYYGYLFNQVQNTNELDHFADFKRDFLIQCYLKDLLERTEKDAREKRQIDSTIATVRKFKSAADDALNSHSDQYNALKEYLETRYLASKKRTNFLLTIPGKLVALAFGLGTTIALLMVAIELGSFYDLSAAASNTVLAFASLFSVGVLYANYCASRDHIPTLTLDIMREYYYKTGVDYTPSELLRLLLVFSLCFCAAYVGGYFAYVKPLDFLSSKEYLNISMSVAEPLAILFAIGSAITIFMVFYNFGKKQALSGTLLEDKDNIYNALTLDNLDALQTLKDKIVKNHEVRCGSEAKAEQYIENSTLVGIILKHKINNADVRSASRGQFALGVILFSACIVVAGAIFQQYSVVEQLKEYVHAESFLMKLFPVSLSSAEGITHTACILAGISYIFMFGRCTIKCFLELIYGEKKGTNYGNTSSFDQFRFQATRFTNTVMNAIQAVLGLILMTGNIDKVGSVDPFACVAVFFIAGLTSFVMSSDPGEPNDVVQQFETAELKLIESENNASAYLAPKSTMTTCYDNLCEKTFRKDPVDSQRGGLTLSV